MRHLCPVVEDTLLRQALVRHVCSWYFSGMYLFMFILFPTAFVYYLASKMMSDSGRSFCRRIVLVMFTGLLAGAVSAGFCAFFTFYRQFSGSSHIVYFLRSWFPLVFFPAVMFTLFVLWSKDSLDDRINAFFLFAGPFYTVWLPYDILRTTVSLSFYILFVNPVLYLCFACAVS